MLFILLSSLSCPLFFRLHRKRIVDSGVCGNQERSRCFGRLPLPRGLRLHQHPWRPIPERQRGSSASVSVRTLPHLGGYSCKLSLLRLYPSFSPFNLRVCAQIYCIITRNEPNVWSVQGCKWPEFKLKNISYRIYLKKKCKMLRLQAFISSSNSHLDKTLEESGPCSIVGTFCSKMKLWL